MYKRTQAELQGLICWLLLPFSQGGTEGQTKPGQGPGKDLAAEKLCWDPGPGAGAKSEQAGVPAQADHQKAPEETQSKAAASPTSRSLVSWETNSGQVAQPELNCSGSPDGQLC